MIHSTIQSNGFEQDMVQDPQNQLPVSVQILSTLLFGGFAIVAVIIALNMFWPGGIVLAIILGWRGGFAPQMTRRSTPGEIADKVRTLSPEAAQRSSRNSSFDSYRSDVLRRLEDEQDSFDNFLGRLRHAKDKSEFDSFMDDRADKAREVNKLDA